MDNLEVKVELLNGDLLENYRALEALQKSVHDRLKSVLGLETRVTLVEREHLGGTCLNIGCIPTKCLLHSAELVSQIQDQGREIGVEVDGVRVNFPQVIAHKNAISKQLTQGVAGLLKANKVAKIDGEATFTGPKTLSVKKSDGSVEEMTADAIIVATGSINSQPPSPA